MATITRPSLTLEEFERRYAGSDRRYEYWHGEVVEKAVPTWLHSVLQALLSQLLQEAGYKAGPEVDLRLDPEFAPRPDVIAGRHSITTRYPTQPNEVEIVIEILSPDDTMVRVLGKCEEYVRIGVAQIYIADPESETAWVWNREKRQLDRTDEWTLTNGKTIVLPDVWRQMHERR
jgi:Uma2 family endonuclease